MHSNVRIITGDAASLPLENDSVDLIVTHPPYLGIDTFRYGGDPANQINHKTSRKKMLKLLRKATKEMYRVLKPGGSLWIANGRSDLFDVRFLVDVADNTNFEYIDSIYQNCYDLYDKNNPEETITTSSVTVWNHFLKGEEIFFNPYELKRNSSAIWDLKFNNLDSPIDQQLGDLGHHVVDVMNEEIPIRLIKMFSKKGQTVLDPFGGSALVAVKAFELGRIGISNDISEAQTKSAYDRLRLSGLEMDNDK